MPSALSLPFTIRACGRQQEVLGRCIARRLVLDLKLATVLGVLDVALAALNFTVVLTSTSRISLPVLFSGWKVIKKEPTVSLGTFMNLAPDIAYVRRGMGCLMGWQDMHDSSIAH